MNGNELHTKYQCETFLMWHTILQKLPRAWKRSLANDWTVTRDHNDSDIYEILHNSKKIAKWAYSEMLKNSSVTTPKNAQEKWERELRTEGVSWKNVFKWVYKNYN